MEWRPIETAPKDGEAVIICAYYKSPLIGEAYVYAETGKWWWANTSPGDYYAEAIDYPVTHWMPLPEPPK